MEQLKPILEKLYIHRFWVANGVIGFLSLVVFYLSVSTMGQYRETLTNKIKSEFQSTQNLAGVKPDAGLKDVPADLTKTETTAFPNSSTIAEMDKITDQAKETARLAWATKFETQKRLLQFPDRLDPAARASFQALLPIEKKLPKYDLNAQDPVIEAQRQAYRDYITKRLPELAEIIGARWDTKAGAGFSMSSMPGMPGMGSMPGGVPGSSPPGGAGLPMGAGAAGTQPPVLDVKVDESKPMIVFWNGANQATWLDKAAVFNGKNGFNTPKNIPFTMQVMYLQEELWILESVFDIVRRVNGEADAIDLADIKKLDHVLVSAEAVSPVGDVRGVASAATAGGGGMPSMDQMKKMMMTMGNTGTSQKAAKADDSLDPTNQRYVDRDFKPIPAKEFRSALTAPTAEKAYLQVAKRVPVRIGLEIKENAIMDFLAECANSSPPIEVRQVRINRHSPDSGRSGNSSMPGGGSSNTSRQLSSASMGPGGGGGTGNAAQSMSVGGSGGGIPGMPGMFPGMGGARGMINSGNDVVRLEIYGIVYIYNEPPTLGAPDDILKPTKVPQNNAVANN